MLVVDDTKRCMPNHNLTQTSSSTGNSKSIGNIIAVCDHCIASGGGETPGGSADASSRPFVVGIGIGVVAGVSMADAGAAAAAAVLQPKQRPMAWQKRCQAVIDTLRPSTADASSGSASGSRSGGGAISRYMYMLYGLGGSRSIDGEMDEKKSKLQNRIV